MDDLIGAFLRLLGTLISEVLIRTLFYWTGWPFVKIFSLGRYPRRGWMSETSEEVWVSLVGVLVIVILLSILASA